MSIIQGSLQVSDYVVRSKTHGCFRIYKARDWGKFLVPIADPNGAEVTSEEVNGIQLNDPFPKLPKDLWSRYIALCFYMCPSGKLHTKFHDSQFEVQVCLLRDNATRTKWKIVVPKQSVSGVSVRSVLANNVDIETGERYTQFPPVGWVHAGSSHSHNTMSAFFSATDDKSELTVPGLHIVVGNICHKSSEYSYKASVVAQKLRKQVDIESVVDIEPDDLPFHKNVLEYITPLISANRKLYQLHNPSPLNVHQKPWLTNSRVSSTADWLEMIGISNSDEPSSESGSKPDVLLIDENGDPTPFFNSLDKTNSDLFDNSESEDEYSNNAIDEEMSEKMMEWIDEGVSIEVMYRTLDYVTGGREEDFCDRYGLNEKEVGDEV